jgi:hypothetical protein
VTPVDSNVLIDIFADDPLHLWNTGSPAFAAMTPGYEFAIPRRDAPGLC